ncbi:imm11 family protein [Olleya sp. 1-3]|uniref:imm11 family protein n=1 Tax=Olleya sp. 1-3 TaxID=2058323 RepID=UPI000C33464B|nr:DUF1629 domain-containing protein [Olleya sp. 1-3]PKG52892.1 hypothetical protein CXF54_03700 [Olleya sp. 1-3]
MKFYSINSSSNKKILGNYPQIKGEKHNCHVWDDEKFIDRLEFKEVNFEPITSNAILYASSNLTDLINISSIGFGRKLLVSNKLKSIIDSKNKDDVKFFKSNLIQNGKEITNYWITNPSRSRLNFINFKKSKVFLTKNYSTIIKQLNITNLEDFLKEKAKIKYPFTIIIKNVNIKKDVNSDFFVLTDISGGIKYIVSKKLKNEIQYEDCTGIEFQPIELELNEWLNCQKRIEKYGKY